MTTRHESASAGTEAPSGQPSVANTQEYTTAHALPQLLERRIPLSRHGTAFLVASPAANVLALSFITRTHTIVPTLVLSPDEVAELRDALTDLIDVLNLDRDARARAWSRQKLKEIVAAADASAESYRSKP